MAKTSSSKAVAPAKKAQLPANIEAQMAQEVAGIAEQIGAPASNAISIRDQVFTLPDGAKLDGPIELVIVDFISRNNFYKGKWDPKNPEPPVCFAINKAVKQLAPSPNSPDMQVKPGQTCAECPMNEFGSDGDGKACKNTRLLAVLPADAAEDEPIMTLSIPPTSIKAFDGYVAQVAKLFNRPPLGVITTVSFRPEASYPMLMFSDPRPLDTEQLGTFFARRSEAEVLLTAEPEATVPAGKNANARGKGNSTRGSKR